MSPERTPEERERARLERERRRALREGRPPPPEPQARTAPPEEPPVAPAAPPLPPKPPPPPPRLTSRPPPAPPAHPPETLPDPTPARPRGVAEARRAAASEFLQRRREAAGARAPRPTGRRALPLAAAGLVLIGVAWFLLSLFQPLKGEGEGAVRVQIPRGVGVGQIGELLEERGVVSSAFFFKARARISGRADDLKPGSFRLKRGMSHAAALDALANGPPPDVLSVTVPEGRSRREVDRILRGTLRGDYLGSSRRSGLIDPRRYGAKRARNLEGFLFPSTYELKRGSSASDLVEQQLRTFRREVAKVDMREAKRRNLTTYDVLVIASMVDREAQIARERPIVASVIQNRLREGIPLGIDATIRFAANNWTRPLTQSQLAIDSPYNTRTRQGLPPGPIGSPGLAAIRAAARPARTDFLFYVVKPGTCGEHDFSKTDAEFQRDVARYNRERERRGGKSPTNC